MKKTLEPTVAIVYDKVNTRYGGAEWVLRALHEAFPHAPLYTSLYDPHTAQWASIFTVFTSFLQRIPVKNHAFLVWLFPLAFESLNLKNYDVVISVTSGEAKGILTRPEQLHISYILTPPRYLYTHAERYSRRYGFLSLPIIAQIGQMVKKYMIWWDSAAVHRADKRIAISRTIQKRIADIYNLESDVLYPPLPIQLTAKESAKASTIEPFLLSLSRLVEYKRIDLSIAATQKLGKTLVIAGMGEELKNLISQAGTRARVRRDQSLDDFLAEHTKNPGLILFVGHVSDAERSILLSKAQALLMPGLEDFGITALEAAWVGTPSVLHAESGVSEILTHRESAIHCKNETVADVLEAIKQLDSTNFAVATLQQQAETCSTKEFTRKFKEYVYDSIIQLKQNSK